MLDVKQVVVGHHQGQQRECHQNRWSWSDSSVNGSKSTTRGETRTTSRVSINIGHTVHVLPINVDIVMMQKVQAFER